MAQSIVDILSREHRHIESLFNQIQKTNGDQREQVFDSLKDMLVEHSRSEERVLYPQLEALVDFRMVADDALEDHAVVDQMLTELSSRDVDSRDWLSLFLNLEEAVLQHVQFEEDRIFSVLREYFLDEELRIMGEEYLRVEGRVKQIQSLRGVFRTLTRTFQNRFIDRL